MQPEEIERLRGMGLDVETVGEIMEGERTLFSGPPLIVPAVLEGTPELPPPGIYFGMPDDEYHALPALSNSGIKKLAASPMIFWSSTSWLSAKKRKRVEEAKQSDEKAHHVFGKAYHCRLMEGASIFAMRFAVELDPGDYPDCLVSTDQIKAAIGKFNETVPVKPVGRSKADFETQLRELDPALTELPGDVAGLKAAIGTYTCEQPVKPWRKVADVLPDGTEYDRDAVKTDWIEQLLKLDPSAKIFAKLQERHRAEHAGKTFLTADQHEELEIAALMVERDPEIQHAFRNGHAEVTLIWHCRKTGVPMKARVDYLKIKNMVDLKSIANQRELSIETAIRFAIGSYKYQIQPCVYFEGAEVVRELVRNGTANVWVADDYHQPREEVEAWAQKWASHRKPDDWLWVFQQKGEAPITRGVWFPRGSVKLVTDDIVRTAKMKFAQFSQVFGVEPWLDVKPTYMIADEEIPVSATEI